MTVTKNYLIRLNVLKYGYRQLVGNRFVLWKAAFGYENRENC